MTLDEMNLQCYKNYGKGSFWEENYAKYLILNKQYYLTRKYFR